MLARSLHIILIVSMLFGTGGVKALECPKQYERDFKRAEEIHSLPRGLLCSVAFSESSFNPKAKSEGGDIGLMQISPRWHPNVDPWNPYASIYYAGSYISQLYKRFGSLKTAIQAYNAGPTRVAEGDIPKASIRYARKILERIR